MGGAINEIFSQMIYLVVSSLNYSKKMSPCQLKEENKSSVLAPYKWGILVGKYPSARNGEDLLMVIGFIFAVHYIYRLLLHVLQLSNL